MLTKEQTVWLSALLRLMGEAGLVAEGAVEAVEESLAKKENKAKEEGDQKKAAPEIGRKAPGKEGPGGGGEKGKFGNVVHTAGSYVASIPPNPKGKFPLVVIFWGNTGKQPVIEGTPPSYFKKAIVAYGPRDGKFSEVKTLLDTVLAVSGTEIGSISICGYSSGGQAAFANYGHATKGVGFIDPNVKKKDFGTFDSKTIYSIYHPNPESWPWSADPSDKKYTIGQARIDAIAFVEKAGGIAEKTKQSHEGYPKYFLCKFEGNLI